MRRSITCLAVLSVAALGFAGSAAATPVVTLKGEAVPIPGFPHTGNILGAGADVEGEFTIKGTEYGGYPPPVIGITLSLPTGTRLFPSGFPTCPTSVIMTEHEPAKCPKGSSAGPTGHAFGFVVFGGERVPEEVSIQPFFAPGGGINFYVEGHTPASIEVTSTGRFTAFGGGGGYGPKAVIQVPLVETVPGAPDASVERIIGKLGAARKVVKGKGKHKKTETIYYGRVPTKCPKGGFPAKAEVTFAALGGLPQQTAIATFKAPCPPPLKKKK
jgi:hypothetical protein